LHNGQSSTVRSKEEAPVGVATRGDDKGSETSAAEETGAETGVGGEENTGIGLAGEELTGLVLAETPGLAVVCETK